MAAYDPANPSSDGWTTIRAGVSPAPVFGADSPYKGSGVPAAGLGNNGDFYFRSDTPGTASQRIYVKSAGIWVGVV